MKFITNGELAYFVPENIDSKKAAAVFATRLGGVSDISPTVASLNLGSFGGRYDSRESVWENYRIIADAFGFPVNNIIYARQQHTDTILIADNHTIAPLTLPIPDDFIYDAMVTNTPGIALTARSADCVPILFYDGDNNAIGAAHCGWRGTAMGLQAKTAKKMGELYGSDLSKLKAAIGPCISKCCYEVSDDVYNEFANILGEQIKAHFSAMPNGKYMCDLKSINKFLLCEGGLCERNITVSQNCTCCEPELFYSHRRDGENRGTHAAFICLKM